MPAVRDSEFLILDKFRMDTRAIPTEIQIISRDVNYCVFYRNTDHFESLKNMHFYVRLKLCAYLNENKFYNELKFNVNQFF